MSDAAWTTKLLGDLAFEVKDRVGPASEGLSVYGVDRHEGLTGETKYVADSLDRYKLIKPGMFAYNPMRLNIGSIGFCKPSFQRGLVSPDYIVFGCKPSQMNPEFLNYAIRGPEWVQWTSNAGVGSVRQRVYFKELARLPITVPPYDAQHAIVAVLSRLDEKINANRQMNETLEALAQTIFKNRFVDATVTNLPKGWRESTLAEVAENPRRGIQPEEIKLSTPYIGLEHMPRRCIALSEWEHAAELESNKFEFERGEILFGKLRPYFHKVGVAPVDGVCSTDILVLRPKAPEWFGFVLGHVSSVELVNHTNAASTGTKMPRANWNDIARFEVALPPESVAAEFTDLIRPMIDRIIANIHESRTLAEVRDALLPKLLSGELRVPGANSKSRIPTPAQQC
jgi:type I restriction enzyme S subunit